MCERTLTSRLVSNKVIKVIKLSAIKNDRANYAVLKVWTKHLVLKARI